MTKKEKKEIYKEQIAKVKAAYKNKRNTAIRNRFAGTSKQSILNQKAAREEVSPESIQAQQVPEGVRRLQTTRDQKKMEAFRLIMKNFENEARKATNGTQPENVIQTAQPSQVTQNAQAARAELMRQAKEVT